MKVGLSQTHASSWTLLQMWERSFYRDRPIEGQPRSHYHSEVLPLWSCVGGHGFRQLTAAAETRSLVGCASLGLRLLPSLVTGANPVTWRVGLV